MDNTRTMPRAVPPSSLGDFHQTGLGTLAGSGAFGGLVCQGLPTRQIADRLHLTTDTVQDHLKSAFDRTGVHSRGELVATILQRDYLPRAIAGDPLSASGAFAAR